ncbi:MAG: outer membrane protein assembly factor BamC [Rubrivivax sp.]|nr:outer membrane protein assembly factor BamC [Rubrivivax sp.]
MVGGSRVDYRSEAVKTPELDVPPDLTQLARDGRFRPQGGVVTASGAAAGTTVSAAAPAATVALNSIGGMRIERQGNHRWLVTGMTPEQLWPQLQSFWQQSGFALTVDNAAAGVMETGWAENRAKLPQDLLRRTLGRLVENLYDTGVRDSFRTRVERTAQGTEVYILHRSVVEQVVDRGTSDRTIWRVAPNDPQLEAEFLSRLLVRLGQPEAAARQTVAAAPERAPAATVPASPAAAAARNEATTLDINESFDRAYRRVGLALDRTGFTVEDRDRSAGLYFVRYVATSGAGVEEPGFLSRIFGGKDAQTPVRYRVLVRAAGEGRSNVSVQNSQGQPETGDVAKRIIGLIANDLR